MSDTRKVAGTIERKLPDLTRHEDLLIEFDFVVTVVDEFGDRYIYARDPGGLLRLHTTHEAALLVEVLRLRSQEIIRALEFRFPPTSTTETK